MTGAHDIVVSRAGALDLAALHALAMRAKAAWGYDAAFMAACANELRIPAERLACDWVVKASINGGVAGVAQVARSERGAELEKLFVEPDHFGIGVGKTLMTYAVAEARARGASKLWIESDPHAAGFYVAMGAAPIGDAPSGSIPGRRLPLLAIDLACEIVP